MIPDVGVKGINRICGAFGEYCAIEGRLAGEHSVEGERALHMLRNHHERIAILVPEKPLADLREVGIWIEYAHPELGAMQYHPGKKWP